MIHCARERASEVAAIVEPNPVESPESSPPIDGEQVTVEEQQQQQRNFLTFGEFCLFANELRKCYERE